MSENEIKPEIITIKITAKAELIYQVLSHLQEQYPHESMSVSKMLKNMHDPDYHVFCTIRLPTKTLNVKEKLELEKDSEGLPLEEGVG